MYHNSWSYKEKWFGPFHWSRFVDYIECYEHQQIVLRLFGKTYVIWQKRR